MIRIVEVFEGERISDSNRKPELFYYELRHKDDDWSMPATIERSVIVNYWGTLVSDKPYPLNESGFLMLSEDDAEELIRIAEGCVP